MIESKPLLSIAIPTFNRAEILNLSLARLIPQIIPFADNIELIISDNCSTDHTQRIVSKYKERSLGLKVITHIQSENTGYYGNFITCKQLSSGKFFWLLSDNEHINYGAIKTLIEIIECNKMCNAFILDCNNINIYEYQRPNIKVQYADDYFNSDSAYSSTLISSVIFKNDHSGEKFLFNQFNNNLFIGFLMFCNTLTHNDLVCSIRHNIFLSYPAKVYFDGVRAWSIDIIHCVKFMYKKKLLDDSSRDVFISGFVKTNLLGQVLELRKRKSIGVVNYSLKDLRISLDYIFGSNETYNQSVRPILFASSFGFLIYRIKYKIIKYFNRCQLIISIIFKLERYFPNS